MPTLRLSELAEATGGALVRGDPETIVDSFWIDGRRVRKGGVFFALVGHRADGHRFVEQAARAGAAAAVIEREPEGEAVPPGLIRVDDTRVALGRSAKWIRRTRSRVRWIALTGSNGKTTTKEMIAEGLATSCRTHRTPGNYNNEIGVPLTLLAMPDDAEAAVIELAMSGPGEIARLVDYVDPDVGLLTNVHAVHMASFRTLDDVAAAKGELFALLRDDATAVVNLDEAHVRIQATRHVGPQITFGRSANADLRLERLENRFLPGAALSVRHGERRIDMQLRIGGAHAAFNALAALATLVAVGLELAPAAERIARLEAGPGRGRLHNLGRGIVVVDDTYNSSPPALASVLETLRLSESRGRKVLIMGDMLELGPMEVALHREAGRRAAASGVQFLVAVGPLSREAAEYARRSGVAEVHHHPDSARAADSVAEFLRPGDLIVVKGSRAMSMERVVAALTTAFEGVG